MIELVEMFLEELPERVSSLEEALTDHDLDTVAMLAHRLKGAAGGYGFPAITQAAQDCEASAKDHEDLEALDQQIRRLADLCRKAGADYLID
jgi:hypothetical protein